MVSRHALVKTILLVQAGWSFARFRLRSLPNSPLSSSEIESASAIAFPAHRRHSSSAETRKNSTARLNAVVASHWSSSFGYGVLVSRVELELSRFRMTAWSRTDSARMYSSAWMERENRHRRWRGRWVWRTSVDSVVRDWDGGLWNVRIICCCYKVWWLIR